MNNCPDKSQLNGLLSGSLTEAVADSLTEHVGECEACQTQMEQLAAGEMPVNELIFESVAAAPPANSAYWETRKSFTQLESFNGKESFIQRSQTMFSDVANGSTKDFADPKTTSPLPQGKQPKAESDRLSNDELSLLQPSKDPNYIGQLHNFEISRVIGRGGMGVVLEGFDPHLSRSVAIKVLNAKFQEDKSAIERFCREGRAAAAVSHEHVVQMYQVARVEEGESAFLVMQLIEGETLEDRLQKESPLAAKEVARIGMQIAAGLSAAHDSGLVHRDIKPGNILIEKSTDRVKLTDFGLARISDELKLTKTGMLLGTALYMSPEQAIGETVDERSDLFSLGAVIYEMATGEPAFNSPTAVGVMKQIMDETPTPPHKLNSAIGKPTSDLIMQLLKKKPKNRPDSAGEVARVLASIVSEHGPISPLQVPAVASSEVKKLSKQHSMASRTLSIGGWLIAGLALAAFIILIATGWSPWEYRGTPNSEPAVILNNKGERDVTDRFSEVLLAGNPGSVWSIDFVNDGNTIAAGIGNGSVRFWDIKKQKVVRSFNAHSGNVWNIKFHPTEDWFATAGDDSWVKLWDLETLDVKQGWKLDNTVRALAFSPLGKHLAAADRDGQLHVYDLKTGREENMIELKGTTILGIDYSPDGKSIVAAGSDTVVRVFDADTLQQRQVFNGHAGPVYSVAFATDSSLIASVGFKSDTWVWNADTGEKVMQLKGFEGDNWGVEFLGETGQHLLTGGQDGTARLWSLKTGENIATFQGHTAAVHDFALDPVGNRIATSSRDGTIRVWETEALGELVDE